jgi:very-short-patch-repair endonuclease
VTHLDAHAHEHLARHHGVIATEQLRMYGHSPYAIRRLVADGFLVPVLRGAYRSPSVRLDELGRCAAVCAAHPELVVAGPTAGRLWGLRRLPRDHRIHVLAPPGSNPSIRSWIHPYRTSAYHCDDVVHRDDGIRVTTRARTALDLTRHLSDRDLRSVIEQVMHDGSLDEHEMCSVAADWTTPGRPWVRRYLAQLDLRFAGGSAESHLEVVVAESLRAAGVRGLVRQHVVDLPGYGRARFDLAVPAIRWAVEVDGHPSHGETQGVRSDEQRDDAAADLGWTVSRIPGNPSDPSHQADLERLAATYRRLLADR